MKYTGTKQVFSSELSIWEARGGRVNEGQCRALRKSATQTFISRLGVFKQR